MDHIKEWKDIDYQQEDSVFNRLYVRGKCIITNEWVIGRLLSINVIGSVTYNYETESYNVNAIIVHQNTIGRFLGYVNIYDTENVRVVSKQPFFEGDICKGSANIMTIVWGNFAFRWGSKNGNVIKENELSHCRVIGNIYE